VFILITKALFLSFAGKTSGGDGLLLLLYHSAGKNAMRGRFRMASACALAMFSGRIILYFAFVALCGALQTHFHGRGRKGKRQLQFNRQLFRHANGSPFEERLPPAGGRCRVATKGGIRHGKAVPEGVKRRQFAKKVTIFS
jgi:hypothetical protein